MTKYQTTLIAGVIARLSDLSTPMSHGCTVDNASKEAVRIYVHSWLIPALAECLDPSKFKSERDMYAHDARVAVNRTQQDGPTPEWVREILAALPR